MLQLAIIIGKLILFLTQTLKIGGGSAAPGLYALKFDPDLVEKLCKQIPQNIIISGTNGKTTTARLLAQFTKDQNLKVIRNQTGSNLERGIASALIMQSNIFGKIKNLDLGIWELDEAAFNKVVFKIKPQLIVFLNVYRDQLDRYGEVDKIVNNWWKALSEVDWEPTLIINGGDPNTLSLAKNPNLSFFEFRIKNHQPFKETSLEKDQQHQDQFIATIIKNKGLDGVEFEVQYPQGKEKFSFPLPGIYNIYNFLAAFSTYYLLNLPTKSIQESLNNFSPAFGRMEKFSLQPSRLEAKKEGYIFLIKNPAGSTQVFETIAPILKKGDRLLIALNDNFADGTDVSWIWDAEFEKLLMSPLSSRAKRGDLEKDLSTSLETEIASVGSRNDSFQVIISGTRAYDLALRLKYAGVEQKQMEIESNLEKAFEIAKKDLLGRLFILPTYTALLELQKILTQQGLKSHYWKDN